jgi:hypothetical protein
MWEGLDPKQVVDMKIAKSQEDIGFYVGFLGEHFYHYCYSFGGCCFLLPQSFCPFPAINII